MAYARFSAEGGVQLTLDCCKRNAIEGLFGKAVTTSRLRGAPRGRADGTVLFVTNPPSPLPISGHQMRAAEQVCFEDDLVLVRQAITGLRTQH